MMMADDQIIRLEDLLPDPDNLRLHPEENLDLIMDSLQEIGPARSITIDTDGVVWAGNGVVEAARMAGITKVRKIIARPDELVAVEIQEEDLEKKRRYAIRDNRSSELSRWDSARIAELHAAGRDLSFAFNASALQEIIDRMPAAATHTAEEKDAIPDPPAEPICQPGDIWILGDHRLMCGNSEDPADIDRLMAGELADLVFTDPPYGVDYAGGSGNVKKREKIRGDDLGSYARWLRHWPRFATKRTPFYIWYASSEGRQVYDAVEDAGLHIRAMIIWHKLKAHYGAYMAQYMQKHEPCLYCHIGSPPWYGPTNEVTVWEYDQPARNDLHPTQKPTALAERAIANSSRPGDLVVDLFGGSGTTMISAEELRRRCYMMELDPIHCDTIIHRWVDLTGREATLLEE
jgi:DNA modification methylase